MNFELIKQEAESFFEWPTDKRTDIVTLTSCLLFAKHCVEIERERIRLLISNDAYACEFQSMGQYRSALLGRLQQLPPAPEAT